ncbi:uncharacterized protein KZ484_001502 [Pholidichthys leucotaenia]
MVLTVREPPGTEAHTEGLHGVVAGDPRPAGADCSSNYPQQPDCKEEVLVDQQLWKQERISVLEQQEREPPQMEEQHEPEPPQENEQSGAEPNSEQVLSHNYAVTAIKDEEGSRYVDSESIKEEEEPKPKKRRLKTRSHNFPQQPDCKEEVLVDQQLWKQEGTSVLEQEEREPPQVKEEEEELFISQEGEQPEVKLEADMATPISEENEQSGAEPNSEQVLSHNSAVTEIKDEEGSWHVDSESIKEEEEDPKPKKRRLKTRSHSTSDDDSLTSKTVYENDTEAPQLHDCKEEEVLTIQQLWNQESNSRLGQEEQDAALVKEEEEELSTNQKEEDIGLKKEADTFMVTPTDEDNDKNETEPNSEQLLSHTSPDTESQDQGAGKNVNPGSSRREEPKNRPHRNRSDCNNVENSPMSENQCDTDTGEKSVKCSNHNKVIRNKSQRKKHCTVDKPHVCTSCGKKFGFRSSLSIHERIHTEFEHIIDQYEEEIGRQRRLLNIRWCPQIKMHKIGM